MDYPVSGGPSDGGYYDDFLETYLPFHDRWPGQSYRYSDYVDVKGNLLAEGDIVKFVFQKKNRLGIIEYKIESHDENKWFEVLIPSLNDYPFDISKIDIGIRTVDSSYKVITTEFKVPKTYFTGSIANRRDVLKKVGYIHTKINHDYDFGNDVYLMDKFEDLINHPDFQYSFDSFKFVSSNLIISEKIAHIEELKDANNKCHFVASKTLTEILVEANLINMLESKINNSTSSQIDLSLFS